MPSCINLVKVAEVIFQLTHTLELNEALCAPHDNIDMSMLFIHKSWWPSYITIILLLM